MTGIAGATAALAGLLGAAVFVAIIAERLRVPNAVALVAFGTVVGAVHPVPLPFRFSETLLFVFLPPLIFEAAWNVDPIVLRRVALPVGLLAFPGVLAVAAVVAVVLILTHQLPPAAAVLLAVIVAPTDPVAVIAIFRRLHVPEELLTIVEGESIANDGVAIVLFGTALAFVLESTVPSAGYVLLRILIQVAGGCAIGAVGAVVIAFAIGRTRDGGVVVAATIVLAFIAYLAADAVHVSGVFATAAAAIVLRGASRREPELQISEDVDAFWGATAFVANAFVFLLTGLGLQLARILHEPLLVAAAVAAVVFSRVPLSMLCVRQREWRMPVMLAGMRGGLSLALALVLPDSVPERSSIIDGVFGVVLFTLVVQGFTLEPVVRRLAVFRQSGSGGPPRSSYVARGGGGSGIAGSSS